jgi:hypothetical protein
MRKLVLLGCLVIPVAVSFSSPAAALCNNICRAKCKANWQIEFTSEKQCIAVWSRRNGPTGRGCGKPGGPFVRCE